MITYNLKPVPRRTAWGTGIGLALTQEGKHSLEMSMWFPIGSQDED